ncbi:MAG: hypothetical protein AB2792_20075 [Candidatus Thiodiazotropha sp.]
MNIYTLPTGYLFSAEYSKGHLETLSIGDYGKAHNVKADFLGYTRPINGVPNVECMPLSEKWVITLSTQYGCVMKCNFCDVPNVKFRGNATLQDLRAQLYSAIRMFPSVTYTERLNIHFARMGEPIFNQNVLSFAGWLAFNKDKIQEDLGLRVEVIHPVLTTSLPNRFKQLKVNIVDWCYMKNKTFNGQAGLQFSINSTDYSQREEMFGGMALSLKEISSISESMPMPVGRKYCLNFAYSTDYIVDADVLAGLFDPEKFMVKITPIHNNSACKRNNIATVGGYDSYAPYEDIENRLKNAGFDVLVFIPSVDEEDGLVTCGNALLGGSKLRTDTDNVRITGLG